MDARGTVAQLGKRDADGWRDASVGEKDAQSGGGTFLWERRTLD